MILLILTAFLMIIPGIRDLSIPLELANLVCNIAIGAEAANAALDLYQVAENPWNAPMAVFGILLRGLSLIKAPMAFGDARQRRRPSDKTREDIRCSECDLIKEQAKMDAKCLLE